MFDTVMAEFIQTVFTTILGIGVCFTAARMFDTDFGTINSAALKLAAVAVFPQTAGLLYANAFPGSLLGVLVYLFLLFVLLECFFDLKFRELIAFAVVFITVSFAAQKVTEQVTTILP
ncbi:MAG: hypothetical protein ABGZ35_05735 [Planctomycetaceae bacterium]